MQATLPSADHTSHSVSHSSHVVGGVATVPTLRGTVHIRGGVLPTLHIVLKLWPMFPTVWATLLFHIAWGQRSTISTVWCPQCHGPQKHVAHSTIMIFKRKGIVGRPIVGSVAHKIGPVVHLAKEYQGPITLCRRDIHHHGPLGEFVSKTRVIIQHPRISDLSSTPRLTPNHRYM